MQSNTVLEVRDLSLGLGGGGNKMLVEGVSLRLSHSRILGLIGASGCGKSLTSLAIMGLLPDTIHHCSGEIYLTGQRIDHLSWNILRTIRGKQMAMILQNPMSCFDPVFTIRHHFKETLDSHESAPQREWLAVSRAALAQVGFESPDEILGLFPFQMSGGMLQRVMVALALMMQVSVLIADEPTTDLDVVSQARVLSLLEHMRMVHGMSVLLITHDLSVIARLAEEVVIMRSGRIVEENTVTSIFSHPCHPYTQALLQAHFSLYGENIRQLMTVHREGQEYVYS